jgi:hypothetical protein
VVAFAYADLGEGPGDGLRLPPLRERPVVGDGWSKGDCPGVGARSIPCLVGEAERKPAEVVETCNLLAALGNGGVADRFERLSSPAAEVAADDLEAIETANKLVGILVSAASAAYE